MSWSVFISYSSNDADMAQKLCSYLENNGRECFIAPRNIPCGSEYAEAIVNGIDNSKVMVLILSVSSNQSPHVLREVERAVSKSIPIIIYKLEDVELSKSMQYFLMTHQWMDAKKSGDFSNILKCVDELTDSLSKASTGDNSEDKEREENQLSKQKSNMKKIIAAAVIILTVAVIGVSYSFLKNDEDDKKVSSENETLVAIKVADTVKLGTYNDEEIEWRVLRMSEDGKEAVLISKNVLTMKAYDAAESGRYSYDKDGNNYIQDSKVEEDKQLQLQVCGNSDWSVSNIRTWLNSSNEVVKYEDQAPSMSSMIEKKNGYDHEPGFLYGFDEKEIAAIKEVENTTAGNVLSDSDFITTKDKVYLLSLEEVEWFEEAGMSVLAEPTQAAIDKDGTTWYKDDMEIFSVTAHYWWLREPVKEDSGRCYIVGNGNREQLIYTRDVGLEGFGIRPAVTVYTDKLAELQTE